MGREQDGGDAGELGELPVEQIGSLRVERCERLVEHEQLGLVQERAAESEPLRHAARVRGDALGADVPETEALEEHADSLTPLRHAVEAPVEIEILERGQVSIEKRLVADEAELADGTRRRQARHPLVRRGLRPGARASSSPIRSHR